FSCRHLRKLCRIKNMAMWRFREAQYRKVLIWGILIPTVLYIQRPKWDPIYWVMRSYSLRKLPQTMQRELFREHWAAPAPGAVRLKLQKGSSTLSVFINPDK